MQFAEINENLFRKDTDPSDKPPADWLTSVRERTNKLAYGVDQIKTVDTGFPAYKDFLAKMRSQAIPGKTLVDHNHPPITGTVTQASKSQATDDSVPFVKASFSTKDYYKEPKLSSHPIRQYVSDKVKYIPQGDKDPFIPMSSKPVPPVMNQTCIENAAKMYSIARHLGQDVKGIDKLFRWMWNLPEDFTLEPYAPQIDPEVTKPWLRLKQSHNYEVPFMIAQQGMIKVTTGSETGVHSAIKWDIDWAWVRTVVRNIMTRICFVEGHPLSTLEGLELKFLIRYDNLLPQSVPNYKFNEAAMTTKFSVPDELRNAIMSFNRADVASLMKQMSYSELLTDMAPLSKPIVSTLPRSMVIRKELEELTDINWLGPLPPYKFVQPVSLDESIITKNQITFQNMYEQYIGQRAMASQMLCKKLFEVKAHLDDGNIPQAYVFLLEFIDVKELDALIILYIKMTERAKIKKQEVWNLFLDGFAPPKKLKTLDIKYLINTANQTLNSHFLWVTVGALKILRQQFAAPNILMIYKYIEGKLPTFESADMVRARLKKVITAFYKLNYKAKVTSAKQSLKDAINEKTKTSCRLRLIKAQLMLQLYTVLVDSEREDEAYIKARDVIMMTAFKYCKKRRRYERKLSDFVRFEYEQKGLTTKTIMIDPETLAKKLDAILDTAFFPVIQKALLAYTDTEGDLDVLFLTRNDYLMKYNKSQKQDRRLKGVMNQITQKYIRQTPDHDYFFAEEEKKVKFRDLLFRDNDNFISFEQLTMKSRVRIKPFEKPVWLVENTERVRKSKEKPIRLPRSKHKKKRKSSVDHKSFMVVNSPEHKFVTMEQDLGFKEFVVEVDDSDKIIVDKPDEEKKIETVTSDIKDSKPVDDGLDDLFGFDDDTNPYGELTDDIYISDYISTKSLAWTVNGFTAVYRDIDPDFNPGVGISMQTLDRILTDQILNARVITASAVEFGPTRGTVSTENIDIH